jgi:hypothetical protein
VQVSSEVLRISEQAFSLMKWNKSRQRNWLTDELWLQLLGKEQVSQLLATLRTGSARYVF